MRESVKEHGDEFHLGFQAGRRLDFRIRTCARTTQRRLRTRLWPQSGTLPWPTLHESYANWRQTHWAEWLRHRRIAAARWDLSCNTVAARFFFFSLVSLLEVPPN